MLQASPCFGCGQSIPGDAPQGLCPGCLMRSALDTGSDGSGTEHPVPGAAESTGAEGGKTREEITSDGEGTPLPDATHPGQIPGYEILEELGRGGMGVVYRARQTQANRDVALKMILLSEHAGEMELLRFRTEAEAIARLQHPHIVQVFEVGQHQGKPFFSMELCLAGNLAQYLTTAPLRAKEAAWLVETLATAMASAHRARVIHRDLKPANVLLAVSGDGDIRKQGEPGSRPLLTECVAKITDFGLAKKLDEGQAQTQTGAILGTPSYMAPEQAGGNKEVGPAADIYALGAILYECLTGRPPFKAASTFDTILQTMHEEPVPPRQFQPAIPRDLETICLKCLRKDPQKRYQSAQALADDLCRFHTGEPILARPVSTAERMLKWAWRRPLVAGLVLAVVSTMIAGTATASWFAWRAENARAAEAKRAEQEKKAKDRARRQEQLANSRLQATRQSLYLSQVLRAAILADRDPALALNLLQDPTRCPENLREFTWRLLCQRCVREQLRWQADDQPLWALAYSPDGKTLAVGGEDGTVQLWDVVRQERKASLPKRKGAFYALAFSPDGKYLVSAGGVFENRGGSGEVDVWDLAQQRLVGSLSDFTSPVYAVAFSPDGKTLATGSRGKPGKRIQGKVEPAGRLEQAGEIYRTEAVQLWDFPQLKVLRSCDGLRWRWSKFSQPISAVAFSPDGKLLVCGAGDPNANDYWVFDPTTGKEQKPLGQVVFGRTRMGYSAPAKGQCSAVFSPDGSTLFGTNHQQTIWSWDVASRKVRPALEGHTDKVTALACSPDGKVIASTSRDGTVRLWDPSTSEERLVLRGHQAGVTALAFTPDGKTLATASDGGGVRFWDVQRKRKQSSWNTRGADLVHVVDNTPRVILSSRGKFTLWDLASGKQHVLLKARTTDRNPLTVSRGTRPLLATRETRQKITIWNLLDRKKQLDWPSPPGDSRMEPVAFAREGKLLATLGPTRPDQKALLVLWDTTTGKKLVRYRVERQSAHDPAEFRRLLKGTKGRGLVRLPPERRQVAVLTPDGRHLLMANSAGDQILVYDAGTGKVLRRLAKGPGWVRVLAVSPDGSRLAVVDHPRRRKLMQLLRIGERSDPGPQQWAIKLLNLHGDQEPVRLQGHSAPVLSLAFSPDGRTLASGGQDRKLRLWHVPTGQECLALSHQDEVSRVCFSPDGTWLVSQDSGERGDRVTLWGSARWRNEAGKP